MTRDRPKAQNGKLLEYLIVADDSACSKQACTYFSKFLLFISRAFPKAQS